MTTLFPDGGIAPRPDTPERGAFLSWLFWHRNVMEPVLILHAAGISHPSLQVTMRDVPEVSMWLSHALAYRPRLLGDRYSAADLLVHSPYASFTDATPDDPAIRDWVARCMARPATARTRALDAALPARAA